MEHSDEALLDAMAAGDADGFSIFYRRHLAAVTAYFARRVADREAAFDLTAETFAAVVVAAPRFDRTRGPAIAWLLGIASHKLTDSLRRQRVEADARRRLALEPIAICDADLQRVEELAADGPDLCELVAGLSPEHRDAVNARVIDERAYREIAADMQCSEAVVRQRVHRGLRRLREQLRVDDMNGFDDLERQLRGKVAVRRARRRWRPPARTLIVAAIAIASAGGVTATATGVIGGPDSQERGVQLLNEVYRDTEDFPSCRIEGPDRRPAQLSALPASDLALGAYPRLRTPATAGERVLARKYGRMAGSTTVLSGGARELRATDGTRFALLITAGRGRGLGRSADCLPILRAELERRADAADAGAVAHARRLLDREERAYRDNAGREGLVLLKLRRDGRLSSGGGTYTDSAARLGTGSIGVTRVDGRQRTEIDGLVPARVDHVLVRSRVRPELAPLRFAVPQQVFHTVLPKRFGNRVAVQWRSASGRVLRVLKLRY